MIKKFKTVKKIKKKKFFLKKRYKKIKDFETNPRVGGTPANENIIIIKVIEKKGKLPMFLKSFKVFKKLVLKTNKIVKRAKFKYK